MVSPGVGKGMGWNTSGAEGNGVGEGVELGGRAWEAIGLGVRDSVSGSTEDSLCEQAAIPKVKRVIPATPNKCIPVVKFFTCMIHSFSSGEIARPTISPAAGNKASDPERQWIGSAISYSSDILPHPPYPR
jgi:hypothetical protein